jgi:hypothetical protein
MYEGFFVEGLQHGHGRLIYTGHDMLKDFRGIWRNGVRYGKGVLSYLDGTRSANQLYQRPGSRGRFLKN